MYDSEPIYIPSTMRICDSTSAPKFPSILVSSILCYSDLKLAIEGFLRVCLMTMHGHSKDNLAQPQLVQT